MRVNADAEGEVLSTVATPAPLAQAFLSKAAERFSLTARGYHRVLRVARTIADLKQQNDCKDAEILEALSFRQSLWQS